MSFRFTYETKPKGIFREKGDDSDDLPAKAIYEIEANILHNQRGISKILQDIMSYYSIHSFQCQSIINSEQHMKNMKTNWPHLKRTFQTSQHVWSQCVYNLNLLPDVEFFTSPEAMLACTEIAIPDPIPILHTEVKDKDQQKLINCRDFLLLNYLMKNITLDHGEASNITSLMVHLETDYMEVHSDEYLSVLMDYFVFRQDSPETYHSFWEIVSPQIQSLRQKYHNQLQRFKVHFRSAKSPSSFDAKIINEIVAIRSLKILEKKKKSDPKEPTKYAKLRAGYHSMDQDAKQKWEQDWSANRQQAISEAIAFYQNPVSEWVIKARNDEMKKIELKYGDLILHLTYSPTNATLLNVLQLLATTNEKSENMIQNKIKAAKEYLYFHIMPAEDEAAFTINEQGRPFSPLEYNLALLRESESLVLLDDEMTKAYQQSEAILKKMLKRKLSKEEKDTLKRSKAILKKVNSTDNMERFFSTPLTPQEKKIACDAKAFQIAANYLAQLEQQKHYRLVTSPGYWTLNTQERQKEEKNINREINRVTNLMTVWESAWVSVSKNKYMKEKMMRYLISQEETHPGYMDEYCKTSEVQFNSVNLFDKIYIPLEKIPYK